MANRDRTGPEGKGPRTGRKKGNCEGAESDENFLRRGSGRRQRPGRGRNSIFNLN